MAINVKGIALGAWSSVEHFTLPLDAAIRVLVTIGRLPVMIAFSLAKKIVPNHITTH